MALLLASLLLVVADPTTAMQPTQTTPTPVAQKKKPKQVCILLEVTGSRRSQRICRNENEEFGLIPGVSNEAGGKLRETHESGASGMPMGSVPPF